MRDGEGTYDKRIQANISSELKERVRELVKKGEFESEAELVRAALWEMIEPKPLEPPKAAVIPPHDETPPLPFAENADDHMHHDLKGRLDLLAWMMTLSLTMMATLGSRLLRARGEDVSSSLLIEETVHTAVQQREGLRRRLSVGWRAFNQAGWVAHHNGSNGSSPGKPR
jgi:hypothetical protein